MKDDFISRQVAIAYAISGLTMEIDGEKWIRTSEVRESLKQMPSALPKRHGRLIDADALRKSFQESIDECHKWAENVDTGEMYTRVSQALGTFVECSLRTKNAPTIIEAEKEETT